MKIGWSPTTMPPAVRLPWRLGEFLQLGLRLREPEAHIHLAVHRRRGGEVLARLLALARASAELAKAEMAVGDERAHAKLPGQRESFAIARARARMRRPPHCKFCKDT